MGVQDSEFHSETKDQGGRRMGGLQEKNLEGDKNEVEEDEAADDGRRCHLFNSTLRDALLADTLLLEALLNPVPRGNLGYPNVFLHNLGNWHVDDLLGSPSLNSVLEHDLRHIHHISNICGQGT